MKMLSSLKPYVWWIALIVVVVLMATTAVLGYKYAHKDVAVLQVKLDTAYADVAKRDSVIADFERDLKRAKEQETKAKE